MEPYADIMNIPRPQLQHHRPMSIDNRAAQFSAFAALTGFDDEIDETARRTDSQHELIDDQLAALNEALMKLTELEPQKPRITVTYFQPDKLKTGGEYVVYTGNLRFLDEAELKLKFVDGTVIAIPMIESVHIQSKAHE